MHYSTRASTVYNAPTLSWTQLGGTVLHVNALDTSVLSPSTGNFTLAQLLDDLPLPDSINAMVLWAWPGTLGLDDRNQFEVLSHLGGAGPSLAEQVALVQAAGVRVFLGYCPWDAATRPDITPHGQLAAWGWLQAAGLDGIWADEGIWGPGWLPKSWYTAPGAQPGVQAPVTALSVAPGGLDPSQPPLAFTPISRTAGSANWPDIPATHALDTRHTSVIDCWAMTDPTDAMLNAHVMGAPPGLPSLMWGWTNRPTARVGALADRMGAIRKFITPLIAPSPSATPSPTSSASVTAIPTHTPSHTAHATVTSTAHATVTSTAHATVTSTAHATVTSTAHATVTSTAHATVTSTAHATVTSTAHATVTSTAHATVTSTAHATVTSTAHATVTSTAHATVTSTAHATVTSTAHATVTSTAHATVTSTAHATVTSTAQASSSAASSASASAPASAAAVHRLLLDGPAPTQSAAPSLPPNVRQLPWLPEHPATSTTLGGEPGQTQVGFYTAACVGSLLGEVELQLGSGQQPLCAVWLLANHGPSSANITFRVDTPELYASAQHVYPTEREYFNVYFGRQVPYAPEPGAASGLVGAPDSVQGNVATMSVGAKDISALLMTPAVLRGRGIEVAPANLREMLLLMRLITKVPLQGMPGTWAPVRQTYSPPPPASPVLSPPRGMLFVGGAPNFPFAVNSSVPRALLYSAAAVAARGHASPPPGLGVQFPWESAPTRSHSTLRLTLAPFFMDATPATNGQWAKFMSDTDYAPANSAGYLAHWVTFANGTRTYPANAKRKPVVYVSPRDAAAYCRWRGGRLPTDWEWAVAASTSPSSAEHTSGRSSLHRSNALRATRVHMQDSFTARVFPWGDTSPNSTLVPPAITSMAGTGAPATAYDAIPEVGSYPDGRSGWGLYDMTGLVRQWVGGSFCDVGGPFTSTCRALARGGPAWQPQCTAASCSYTISSLRNDEHTVIAFAADFQARDSFTGVRCLADTPTSARQLSSMDA